jgi:WS/DGAT/MGAT family acyltransferase
VDKLGLFDQFFYKADQYGVISMIMGGASVLAPAKAGDTLDADAIADHLAARLQEIPLLRVKLVQDPLRLGSVHKVEDPEFNIEDHISVMTLPAPGGYAELAACLAELSAQGLALSELWHWTVIEGLEGGRLAVDCRIHHALADGVGIVEALSAMYDAEPMAPERPVARTDPTSVEPSPLRLLRDAVAESAQRLWVRTPRFLLKTTGPALGALGDGIKELAANRDDLSGRFGMPDVRTTSLNVSGFSDGRSLAWKTLPLPEVKILAKHFACKVNDIGLLLFSFAMQHYFEGIGEVIDFDLWCAMPLSTRGADDAEGGNQVTVRRLSLHNTIADPLERLEVITRDAQAAKASARPEKPVIDMQALNDVVFPATIDLAMFLTGRLNLMGRAGERFGLANAIFSNVPGPPVPVYVANGVMVESIPKIPVANVIALSGGFTSLEKSITIGFHCDGSVEQPEFFVAGVDTAWEALQTSMASSKKGAA